MTTKAVHAVAKHGFVNASLYDKARPGFPREALAALWPPSLDPATATVLEIGSGTGKFTSLLRNDAKIANLVAVEPLQGMRATFEALFPDVRCVDGTATALPVADDSQDALFIAQAFHWFDNRDALVEFRRVLKPNGSLGLIWNMEDATTPWVAKLRAIYEAYDGVAPQYRTGKWANVFAASPDLFGPLSHTCLRRVVPVASKDQIWERVLSKSYISTATPDVQARVKADVMAILDAADFEIDADGCILYPYVTDIYVTTPTP
ncbi:hypothetical protein SPRG_07789 [Saprolegnia parasitica CBS 223.65]|uniref:Methyltransferase type 11 domain-containing protein n=1 Tax=Saprolegnia parasitica (strain CBS 223.65) TaxID=695850 RepID=A0A067C8I4_SAPPC|nr:hypothetical protein SPRG_07789 [Saprolegnia parasitica CBS 223.65]KDO27079.1 hypothetical protein SPRG_07789 [Saprolegnia parasitica CBS 223.65]|eukprot:XP_012202173.1 hypothetical protein SPRG_07789 [Saprolegnia parasitica CBS 223.65]